MRESLIFLAFTLLLWSGGIFICALYLLAIKILRWFAKMFDVEELE